MCLNSDVVQSWNESIHELQPLSWWDDSWFNLLAKIACGIWSACIAAHTFTNGGPIYGWMPSVNNYTISMMVLKNLPNWYLHAYRSTTILDAYHKMKLSLYHIFIMLFLLLLDNEHTQMIPKHKISQITIPYRYQKNVKFSYYIPSGTLKKKWYEFNIHWSLEMNERSTYCPTRQQVDNVSWSIEYHVGPIKKRRV